MKRKIVECIVCKKSIPDENRFRDLFMLFTYRNPHCSKECVTRRLEMCHERANASPAASWDCNEEDGEREA